MIFSWFHGADAKDKAWRNLLEVNRNRHVEMRGFLSSQANRGDWLLADIKLLRESDQVVP